MYIHLLLIFFSFHFHFTVIDDEDDDGIDIIMVVGLEVKWHMGRWLLVPLYQSHNWISMWPNTIFLSSIFHLLSLPPKVISILVTNDSMKVVKDCWPSGIWKKWERSKSQYMLSALFFNIIPKMLDIEVTFSYISYFFYTEKERSSFAIFFHE